MPVNFDEKLLLSQRIDPAFEEPVLNQILRIAIYDEYHAFETYSQVIQKFGPVMPFTNIIEAEKRHYSALLLLCEKYQVEPPVNDWSERLETPDSLLECSEVGVAAEIDNIAMYEHLLMYTQHADIQDVLFQLQAASYNNHLPAFRRAVTSYAMSSHSNTTGNTAQADTQTAAPEDLLGKMDDYKALIQSVMNGNIDQAELGKLLSSSNLSLISGLLMGGFGTMLFNNMKNDSADEPHKAEADEAEAEADEADEANNTEQ